jgi:hypothetical protein
MCRRIWRTWGWLTGKQRHKNVMTGESFRTGQDNICWPSTDLESLSSAEDSDPLLNQTEKTPRNFTIHFCRGWHGLHTQFNISRYIVIITRQIMIKRYADRAMNPAADIINSASRWICQQQSSFGCHFLQICFFRKASSKWFFAFFLSTVRFNILKHDFKEEHTRKHTLQ